MVAKAIAAVEDTMIWAITFSPLQCNDLHCKEMLDDDALLFVFAL